MRQMEAMNDNSTRVLIVDGASIDGFSWLPVFKETFQDLIVIAIVETFGHECVRAVLGSEISGCLLKPYSLNEILSAVNAATTGGVYVSSAMKDHLARLIPGSISARNLYGLTTREEGILRLLVEGDSAKQIADKLSISFFTVQTHLKHLRTKLEVNSSMAAMSKALKEHFFG